MTTLTVTQHSRAWFILLRCNGRRMRTPLGEICSQGRAAITSPWKVLGRSAPVQAGCAQPADRDPLSACAAAAHSSPPKAVPVAARACELGGNVLQLNCVGVCQPGVATARARLSFNLVISQLAPSACSPRRRARRGAGGCGGGVSLVRAGGQPDLAAVRRGGLQPDHPGEPAAAAPRARVPGAAALAHPPAAHTTHRPGPCSAHCDPCGGQPTGRCAQLHRRWSVACVWWQTR